MSETTIADVGITLIRLLEVSMEPKSKITLLSPVDREDENLTIFLYSIIENPYLKNEERQMVNPAQLEYPPLSLDLYYLLTSYSSTGGDDTERIEGQHEILSRAMRVFYDNGILRGTILQGGLAGTDQELRVTLNPITVEDLTRIWSVFPNQALMPSVSYLVTPARIDSRRSVGGRRVVSKQMDHDHMVPIQEGV